MTKDEVRRQEWISCDWCEGSDGWLDKATGEWVECAYCGGTGGKMVDVSEPTADELPA